MDDRLIPQAFKDNLQAHFNLEVVKQVLDGINSPASISVRNHPNKLEPKHFEGMPIPWSETGVLLEARPSFAQDPLFHAGCYYVQDSSSMILEQVLKQLSFNTDEGLLGLDMCAAPGGKTLIASDFLTENGVLISNEIDEKRNAVLRENVLKWGASNAIITQLSSSNFHENNGLFDFVILDAPCSGEGMFRKDSFAIEQWSESLVYQCQKTQCSILNDLTKTVKTGGYLIYSTCTMNPHENEDQISSLLSEGFELVDLAFDQFDKFLVPATRDGLKLGYYLLPGISTGEGLFISVVRKIEETESENYRSCIFETISSDIDSFTNSLAFTHQWQPDQIVFALNDRKHVSNRIPSKWRLKSVGIPVAEQKGSLLLPYHGLAMHPNAKPDFDLNHEEALNYLRKERISAAAKSKIPWQKIGYKGHCLGWAKQVPGRWNNYYPSHYRLRT